MDIPLYITLGLLAGGYALNKEGKQSRKISNDKFINGKNTNGNISVENVRSGNNNVYDMGYYKKVKEIEEEKVIKNFEKSFNPIATNIIPYFFNTLNESNVKRTKNSKYNKNIFIKELSNALNISPELVKLEPKSNDLSVVATGNGPHGPNGVDADNGFNTSWGQLLSKPETVNKSDIKITHNNMVPFFGSSTKQNMDIENRRTESKLEQFTGQFKLEKQTKTEAPPLFAPTQQNLEMIVAPRQMDRYTSNLQVRNNELPFEQVHVGPGINKGYTAQPSGGFHNTVRILPKTLEELCVNSKTVNEGRVVRGKHRVDSRPLEQQHFKYRPELLVKNENGERNFTTVGGQTRPKIRSKFIIAPTERIVSKKILGIPTNQGGSLRTLNKLLPKSKITVKPEFKNTPFRNTVKVDGKNHHNNQEKSFENRKNERSTTQIRYGEQGHCFSNLKQPVEKSTNHYTDEAKKTRKQSYIMAQNPSGYVHTSATGLKGKAYNPFDVTRTTIRETTEQDDHLGIVQAGGASGMKGKTYDKNDIMRTTIRETTEQDDHLGIVQAGGASGMKGKTHDKNDIMRTTIRETTEQDDHVGIVGKTSLLKQSVYDPHNVAKTTIRETTEQDDHVGIVGKTSLLKQSVYDPHNVAKTTIRETTEQDDHVGIVGKSDTNKHIVYDPFDCAKTTIREMTENNEYKTSINSSYLQNGQGYKTAPTDVKNTQREDYSDWQYVGAAGQADAPSNPQLYNHAYEMRQNVNKEKVAKGRYPTLSGTKINVGKANVNINIKKMERDQLNQYSVLPAPTLPNVRNPMKSCELTSIKNNLPQNNSNFDTSILSAFNMNPLTQPLNSWA
jgi:hypothetical protein